MRIDKFKNKIPVLAIIVFYFLYFMVVHFYIYPKTNLSIIKLVEKNNYLADIPHEVDFLILGDSSGLYNINPKILSKNSHSAANVASTLFLTDKTVSKLKDVQIKRGIIITQTFINDHYGSDLWKIHVPANSISLKDIFIQLCSDQSDACNFNYKIEIVFKFILTKMHLDIYSLVEFLKFFNELNMNRHENYAKWFSENIKTNNGHFSQSTDKRLSRNMFYESYENNFKSGISSIPSSELRSLKKIIRLASARQVPLFFVLTPLDSTEKLNYQKYEEDVQKFIGAFAKEIVFINGNKLNSGLINSDFIDFNHLNKNGANKFSKQLAFILNASL